MKDRNVHHRELAEAAARYYTENPPKSVEEQALEASRAWALEPSFWNEVLYRDVSEFQETKRWYLGLPKEDASGDELREVLFEEWPRPPKGYFPETQREDPTGKATRYANLASLLQRNMVQQLRVLLHSEKEDVRQRGHEVLEVLEKGNTCQSESSM